MSWISIKETLPKDEQVILITDKYGIEMAMFHDTGKTKFIGLSGGRAFDLDGNHRMTHWMPMPELPVDQTEEQRLAEEDREDFLQDLKKFYKKLYSEETLDVLKMRHKSFKKQVTEEPVRRNLDDLKAKLQVLEEVIKEKEGIQ